MLWTSFKDKYGRVQSFEVDKYQEDILRFIETTLDAIPLVANTPENGRVTVCYRFKNGNEIGILLNDTAPTFYINEKIVENNLCKDREFNSLIENIKDSEKGGHIYPHPKHKLPNTTVLRAPVKTLSPTFDNRIYVISQVSYGLVIKLLHLVAL
ncbi:hypothetical protein NLHDIDDJ_01050 [Acinetobacter baumannii]|uniref:hypothetical protein n=1 Tax=Acinetobacter baumannii TaxID=470 RepID=UPI001E417107|nr:hypothetical protein [Acinetobacter baumannii]UDY19411.1 hypothetical protein NLHDIDDJ_01050 [Acinetobacter baumannii]